MRTSVLALVASLVFGLGAVAPEPAAAATPPKVVIVVGATHSATSKYRSTADVYYAEALKYTPNVVRVYSPNATWAAVKSALQGASIVIYLGHGNGFPSPYRTSPWPYSQNGFGLNKVAGDGDNNTQYFGEYYIGGEIKLAPNAVVLLNHLCYASGNSEPGHAGPSRDVARQRVDNYAAGFLKAGARAVIAEGTGSLSPYLRAIFTQQATIEQVWRSAPSDNGNVFTFSSARSPGYVAAMDPDGTANGYYRSLVGSLSLRTEEIVGTSSTSAHPDTFVVPGAAAVVAASADVYADASLTGTPTASLAADTAVRVEGEGDGASGSSSAGPAVLLVRTLDGAVAGYVAADALAPRDSLSPVLWSLSGLTVLSPNGDGKNDSVSLQARLSEPAGWRMRILDSSATALVETSGSGDLAKLTWNGTVGGTVVANGTYAWRLEATDAWGNPPLVSTGKLVVDARPEIRYAGSDRYATAAAVSAATYAPGVPVAFVATGLNFPDALAGAAAAGTLGGPLLLVTRDAIPAATKAELTRVKPARIVVLGSSGVVSAAVATALDAYTAGPVTRLGGEDRYATAAAVSAATYAPGVPVAFVATGLNFPDALAGAAAAGSLGGPLLLVTRDELPDATVAELVRLKPGRIVVLGSTAVVSAPVETALRARTAGTVSRHAGADRYATAAAVSAATFAAGVSHVFVATGLNFPDALAGAAAAGRLKAPLLLVTKDGLPPATAAELARLDPKAVVVLGSAGVVSESTATKLRSYQAP